MISLDEVVYPEDDNRQVPRIETVTDRDELSVLAEIEKGELRSFLVLAMDRLTEQEKLVIALYYFEELTLKEIGEVMTISESRVSQIHTRGVMKLRNMVREKFALTGLDKQEIKEQGEYTVVLEPGGAAQSSNDWEEQVRPRLAPDKDWAKAVGHRFNTPSKEIYNALQKLKRSTE